ncbi:MAG: amidohydrolase [Clostridia bacterium]|nr:amidohydrolase [Clostridia bacterium]
MLFKNINFLDENFHVQENQFVGIKDRKIAYIGSERPAENYGEEYDGKGKILLPGFYNAHSHSPMTLLRGYGENLSLADWLNTRIFPFEDKLNGHDVYYATLLAAAEMLRFGIVSTSDMYYFCQDMSEALLLSGVKCNLSRGTTCFDDSNYWDLAAAKETQAVFEQYHRAGDGRILIDVSLHAEYTSNPQIARNISEHCQKLGAIMHIHLSETQSEVQQCKERHQGLTPPQYFAQIGLLDNPVLAAHCVWLEGDDFDLLAEKKASIATCPKSNLKLASGIADIVKIKQKGINLALGTDSVASNNNLNMLEEMKLFALLHKGSQQDPTLITPQEAWQAATLAGAKAQGRDNCGLIKLGYQADLQVWEVSAPYWQPVHNLLNNSLYSACGTDVVLTMVDGQVLYQNGEYKTIDLEKVYFEVEKSRQRILSELK